MSERTQESSEKQANQRRLEGAIAMLQSDRSTLVRRSDELDAEIRSIEKTVRERVLDIEERKSERSRILQHIQTIDSEIMQQKRASFTKNRL